ncbi:hypothetical protein UMM65_10435 [Aureibaculum sp. 2210JD6-5]|uniref:MORN repeat-containing protein n=1 Tax=Aureibaculum sp. 2210JD6-5 TaxID=3103957 RepID=UPI002AAD97FF|nr:hypothetical protein [Aureibaculum sp. 2210JD6-5]MDY7395660.1 hypothetical protein [Aureibaculum sp. 2210JD6-5]
MKNLLLTIITFLVFLSGYAQHYFTLPQLEKICFKLNNDDIYAVRDYVENVGYKALKVDDFYTFDDSKGNHFITSGNKSGKSKYIAYFIKNPSEKLVKYYMNELKSKYNKGSKFYFKEGLYVILADHDKEKNKFTLTVAYNRRLEYPVPVVKISNQKYKVSSFSTLTPIKFKKGQTITLKAFGNISVGVFAGKSDPNGIKGFETYNYVRNFPHGSLLGKIGKNGRWFLIGSQKTITATTDGFLDVRVNDLDPGNNSGYYTLSYVSNDNTNSSNTTTSVTKCVNGDCKNGQGKMNYSNGDSYLGNFKNGFREGVGIYNWANGDKYSGEWIKGNRTGTGTFTWANGNEFIGKYKDNKQLDGVGFFTWKNGTKYKGQFVNTLMHGYGELYYATGDVYKGDFAKNKRHGKGKLYDKSGKLVYDGLWEQDKKVSE